MTEVEIEMRVTDMSEFSRFQEELDRIDMEVSQEEPSGAFPGVETALVIKIVTTLGDLAAIVIALDRIREAAHSFTLSAGVDTDSDIEDFLGEKVDIDLDDLTLLEQRTSGDTTTHIYEEDTGLRHVLETESGTVTYYKVEK